MKHLPLQLLYFGGHVWNLCIGARYPDVFFRDLACTRESKKLSALLFFQRIYTKVGVEQVRHFST
jgi:hypothetical protein